MTVFLDELVVQDEYLVYKRGWGSQTGNVTPLYQTYD